MAFCNGEYVMYGTAGVCRISGSEKRSFDGVHSIEYCRLIPYGSENSTYYVPMDTLDTKVRKLITRDEIEAVIAHIPDIATCRNSDNSQRKAIFGDLLKSDDYEKIFCLIKSVYEQRKKRESCGKKLAAADEKAMKAAESMVCQEFSAVLGISPESVTDFIGERIEIAEKERTLTT